MCAVRTPSGRAVAAPSSRGGGGRARGDVDEDAALTDAEVVERVSDRMWEPAVFNLGQALRRMGRYGEAASCFARCCSLDPVSGFVVLCPFCLSHFLHVTKHFSNDLFTRISRFC